MDTFLIEKITDTNGNERLTEDYVRRTGRKCYVHGMLGGTCFFEYIPEQVAINGSGFITSTVQGVLESEDKSKLIVQTLNSWYYLKQVEEEY